MAKKAESLLEDTTNPPRLGLADTAVEYWLQAKRNARGKQPANVGRKKAQAKRSKVQQSKQREQLESTETQQPVSIKREVLDTMQIQEAPNSSEMVPGSAPNRPSNNPDVSRSGTQKDFELGIDAHTNRKSQMMQPEAVAPNHEEQSESELSASEREVTYEDEDEEADSQAEHRRAEPKPQKRKRATARARATTRMPKPKRCAQQVSRIGKSTGSLDRSLLHKRLRKDPEDSTAKITTDGGRSPDADCIVAIDLGCTFSGCCFAVSTGKESLDNIHTIKTWPAQPYPGPTFKTPTVLALHEENPIEKDQWGYNIDELLKRVAWFKLLFAAEGELKDIDDPLLKEEVGKYLTRLPEGITIEDLLQRYYKYLNAYVQVQLRSKLGAKRLRTLRQKFVITVPASYKEAKKQQVVDIVARSGICDGDVSRISIISEADAAATVAISQWLSHDNPPFKKGEAVMTLDCGGGTSDITTSKIQNLVIPIRFSEAINQDSGLVGGTTIVRAFLASCGQWFGKAFQSVLEQNAIHEEQLCEKFEKYMHPFDDSERENRRYKIAFPELAQELEARGEKPRNYDFLDKSIVFWKADMVEFFNAFKVPLYRVLRQHHEKASGVCVVKTLIFCGGCAQNPTIVRMLEHFCHKILKGEVELVVTEDPWIAVAKGAVMQQLFPKILQDRKSYMSLGFRMTVPFDDNIHTEADAYFCDAKGKRADNQLQFMIHKGDSIRVDTTKDSLEMYIVVRKSQAAVSFGMDLYKYEGDGDPAAISNIHADGVEHFASVTFRYTMTKHFKKKIEWVHDGVHDNDAGQMACVPVAIQVTHRSENGLLAWKARIAETFCAGEKLVKYTKDIVR